MTPEDPLTLKREMTDLRNRLEEAEEIIRAIREGEIDALVVRHPKRDEEVFTIEGGTESYRTFMEAMDIGAAALSPNGQVLYVNSALSRLMRVEREKLQAVGLEAGFDNAAMDAVEALIKRAHNGRSHCEISFLQDSEERHVLIHAAPLELWQGRGVALTFTDITHRMAMEQAQQSEQMALAILASAAEAVIVCNSSGIITHANEAVGAITGEPVVGKPFAEAVELVIRLNGNDVPSPSFIGEVIGGRAFQGVEAIAPSAPSARDLLISAAPLKVTGQKIAGCVVTLVDLTRRKIVEKQQLLLMGELDHRVKNTLALVLSISNRTASTEETIEGFRSAFSGRMRALAATHNTLAERSWSSIPMRDILLTEVQPFEPNLKAKLTIDGKDFQLLPRAAIAVGLIVHELATNAVKYGALSSEAGHIQVTLAHDPDRPYAELHWIETGGPYVPPPTRTGFGRTVITRSMQYSPHGGADLDYRPEGVSCTIRIPAEDVV
jgi:PAS domain S-box-containing protein